MTVATAQISESLQTLIDSRLDTIDRMLLGQLPGQERIAIVTEVEAQIHELPQTSDADELTREDVLAVLGAGWTTPGKLTFQKRMGPRSGAARQMTASRPRFAYTRQRSKSGASERHLGLGGSRTGPDFSARSGDCGSCPVSRSITDSFGWDRSSDLRHCEYSGPRAGNPQARRERYLGDRGRCSYGHLVTFLACRDSFFGRAHLECFITDRLRVDPHEPREERLARL